MSEFVYEVAPGTEEYYNRSTLEAALADAKTRVAEWDYEADPHGYCHERPDWVRLIEAVDKAQARQ